MNSMIRIDGCTFRMGSDRFYGDERPAHHRTVDAFLIDEHAVTNDEFAAFVADTGYVTVAERPLPEREYAHLPDQDRQPGALVFTRTTGPVRLDDWRQWWRWVPGAQWRHPEGPTSDIADRGRHPVVQVAYDDALAYATWAGKRLPTEAEHEYAAHGGLDGDFAWGDEPYPGGIAQANTWLGSFPYDNRGGFGAGTAPVGSYPANGYGLLDMIGNVWEWTSDPYTDHHVDPSLAPVSAGGRPSLLTAVPVSPSAPARRVLKGGSYLCSPDYCLRFRPAARSPQADDTATTHIGFRCARNAPPATTAADLRREP